VTVRIVALLPGRSLASEEGSIGFCGIYLIELEDAGVVRLVLVDPGHAGRRKALLGALARLGLEPTAIDVVVLTHAHWDHVQNVDLFPKAQVLIHEAELAEIEGSQARDHVTAGWTRLVLDTAHLLAVSEGYSVGPGVSIVHLPGHTGGSIGLLVEVDDLVHVLTGDAIPSAMALADRRPRASTPDLRALESIDRVGSLADVVWPGHDAPFRVVGGRPAGYLDEPGPLVLRAPAGAIRVVSG